MLTGAAGSRPAAPVAFSAEPAYTSALVTGVPIYLVSACASGEEFVAAFRRYADRNGVVFVPLAEPLPSGKKARFALTLKDGGVMVEGDAEVVSSARTPSVLYGRIGMTLKFTLPDEPSKTTLGELEKARLALKPLPPSVPPRSAQIPAAPRATPPAPSGRIDAVNALAECVAIGELGTTDNADTIPPKNASQKFVVPTIPPMGPGSGRIKAPTVPPMPVVRPPMSTTLGVQPLAKPPTPAAGADLLQTRRGPAPAVDLTSTGKADLSVTMRGTKPPTPAAPTPAAPMPIVQQPAPPIVAERRVVPEIEVNEPTDLTAIPQVDDAIPDALSDTTVPVEAPEPLPPEPVPAKPKPRERKTVMGVAVVPSGVMVLPAAPALRIPSEEESRDTSEMQVQKPTAARHSLTVRGDAFDDVDALSKTEPPQALRALNVEEPTPSGDWTMTPGANGPTITPTLRGEKPPSPAGPPTGDWLIALDPSTPDGWGEPSKIEKRPAGELPPGPPVLAVASSRPLDSNARAQTELPDDAGPKVQIDPTLIEPLSAMPTLDPDEEVDDPALPSPPAIAQPMSMVGSDGLMPIPSQAPAMVAPLANLVSGRSTHGFDAQPQPASVGSAGSEVFADSAAYSTGSAPLVPDAGRGKRMMVILASAVAVVVLAIVAVVMLGGTKASTTEPVVTPVTPSEPIKPSEPVPPAPDKQEPDTQAVVVPAPPADAGAQVEVPVVDAATAVAVEPTDCKVTISSAPAGAEILIDKAVVGTTPSALTLPCSVGTKVTLRKARYVAQSRAVTPKPVGQKPVKIVLARVTFSVKVSSTPAGAAITVGSKPMGFTPTTVKLPAFELSTLTIKKDGFTADTQKITPKQSNLSVHTTLKKLAKRAGR
ncbi:MAG: hypothetical protein JWP01_235 [Myxococcales bacterium]|nr:hypothetical protein [Myxococcales bacterium]